MNLNEETCNTEIKRQGNIVSGAEFQWANKNIYDIFQS